jgi:SPP1 family predicted phage head-tail adaptor
MGCVGINIGDLRHKLVIQRVVDTPDGLGGSTGVWTADPVGGVWSSLRNLTSTERWEAHRIMPGNVVRCIIRWRDDGADNPYYSAKDRVLYRGRYFTILSVIDLQWEREYIQMDIQEGKP